MSTNWTYQCTSHVPVIEADNDINHGIKQLMELLKAFQRGEVPREKFVGNDIEINVDIWGSTWPWHFLLQHKDCHVRVVSEYGDIAWRDPATDAIVYTMKNGETRNA